MRTKLGAIIFSIGLIYIVIAVIIFFNKGDLFLTNINMGLIKNILFAAQCILFSW